MLRFGDAQTPDNSENRFDRRIPGVRSRPEDPDGFVRTWALAPCCRGAVCIRVVGCLGACGLSVKRDHRTNALSGISKRLASLTF